MRWLCMEEHAGSVGFYMMMMFYVDDLWWIMLDLELNDNMMMHMKCNYDIYA